MPLHIGKSVNIRQRVLDYLRTPEEARLLRQTRRIDAVRTAGDLGAQLLEAQQIKLRQAAHNKRLRRRRRLCSIRLLRGRVEAVQSHEIPFASAERLQGLFSSRAAALQALRAIADDNRLCYELVGLERLAAGRALFPRGARPLRRPLLPSTSRGCTRPCRRCGWCHGPTPGTIGLVEAGADMTQIHVVRDWHYLGSATRLAAARRLVAPVERFDHDGYRILMEPVTSGRCRIILL